MFHLGLRKNWAHRDAHGALSHASANTRARVLEKTGMNQHEIGKWNMAGLGCVFNGRAERDCEVLSPVTAGWSCGHRSIAKMPESGYDLWHGKVWKEWSFLMFKGCSWTLREVILFLSLKSWNGQTPEKETSKHPPEEGHWPSVPPTFLSSSLVPWSTWSTLLRETFFPKNILFS